MAEYVITAYLDTRRAKDGDVYPVKVRVYFDYKTRFYPTGIDLTEEQFRESYLAEKPKGETNKELKLKIQSKISRASDIAGELKIFDFDKFEKRLLRKRTAGSSIIYHYQQTIQKLKKAEHFNTASSYDLSLRSIITYIFHEGKYQKLFNQVKEKSDFIEKYDQDFSINNILEYLESVRKKIDLSFDEVNAEFLTGYEKWMIKQGKSRTTVGIYLRPLRAVYNYAIDHEGLSKEFYPFGKNKYKIPGGRKVKKALSKPDIKKLLKFPIGADNHLERARDFWLFTYLSNGMNVRDMCDLKDSNYNGNTIIFYRHKIGHTTKEDQKPIIVPVTDYIRQIIDKYGNKERKSNEYLFPFFNECRNEEERVKKAKNTVRYINQHLKRLAKFAGVTCDISCNWARHSFTTIAINNGAPMEFIQDSLGHQSISTTMTYWGGFEENVKKDIADKLLD